MTGYRTSLAIIACFLVASLAPGDPPNSPVPPQVEDLPDESQLPAKNVPKVGAGQLPDESQLPTAAGGDEANGNLPGEEELPGRQLSGVSPPGVARAANDFDERLNQDLMAPVAGKSPILRLAYDGHTGTIRSIDLSDGGRTLVTGGEDKEVHVWRRSDIAKTGWMHLRTIRWPVTRGPRGAVYTTRMKDDLVAFAGYGSFAGGEIRIVNAASGDTVATLTNDVSGNRTNIASLDWSPGKELQLAATDVSGRVVTWQPDPVTGFWTVALRIDSDLARYGEKIANDLQLNERRAFVPVTYCGTDRLIVPHRAKPQGEFANWHLRRVGLQGNGSDLLTRLNHIRHVRALDASDDGKVLASCDRLGRICVWKFVGDAIKGAQAVQTQFPPHFVRLSRDGQFLLSGSYPKDASGVDATKLTIFDLRESRMKIHSRVEFQSTVQDAVIDLDKMQVVAAVGSNVFVIDLDEQLRFIEDSRTRLGTAVSAIQNIAFRDSSDSYRIAIGWRDNSSFDVEFDLSESKLLSAKPDKDANFVPAQRLAEIWEASANFKLMEDKVERADLSKRVRWNAPGTAVCTLPAPSQSTDQNELNSAQGKRAVFVGSGSENMVYTYMDGDSKPPKIVRQFRGHFGEIKSLGTSADGRYLVSGSEDAMVSVWNLQGLFTAPALINRWGCEFAIESNQLIASEVREDGPLYFRGVRGGDQLVSIGWTDAVGELFAESDPVKMRQQLLDLPLSTMVVFQFQRLRTPLLPFNSFPAWRPLATLFVDDDREWAFWTPAGYYDASFNGHQKFGWLLNRQRDQPVDFFRAAQFHDALERPKLMRKLLDSGSLPAAMRHSVSQIQSPQGKDAIVNQIETKPQISLVDFDVDRVIEGDDLEVVAKIELPIGSMLVDAKAFISGVPAISRAEVNGSSAEEAGANRPSRQYRWRFRLPRDRQLTLEIIAATNSDSVDRVVVPLVHKIKPDNKRGPGRLPQLHVLAIGAGDYRDPQIQSLDFAADAADRVSSLFRTKSNSLYRTTSDQLIDEDATRPMWRAFVDNAANQLRETVSPDDLVIMYLCGHGMRDRSADRWYFVTADAKYNDLMNDQFEDCIAFSDLAALAKLPCRKLAILDSCHSGAVQPMMRQTDLKAALRLLQDDLVITLTASEGDEEAAEQRETQLGRFTAAMVDGLNGVADQGANKDGIVSLVEIVEYVKQRISIESESDGMPQHPTASPDYLLKTLQLPLTSASEN